MEYPQAPKPFDGVLPSTEQDIEPFVEDNFDKKP